MSQLTPDIQQLRGLFPAFDQHELLEWIAEHAQVQDVPEGAELMHVGGLVRYIPLLLSGSIKVSREDEEGREIFLYYILPGETCAMTLSACYKGEKSRINAITQEDSRAVLLPATSVHELTRRFPAWQRFAFISFGLRYDELLQTLESVVFQQLDERLLHYLQKKAAALNSRQLHISQQTIADDLNASREVISRLIRQFEKRGWLRHARGVIEMLE